MANGPKTTRVNVIPTLRYDDSAAAVDWLCKAFGFERHLVVPGDDGEVVHAQLVFGNGMVMVGSMRDDAFGRHVTTPARAAGRGTGSPYIVVEDADAHLERAVAAGAKIAVAIEDAVYGGRGYSCRDPEGHLWSFGTYDPWAPE